MNRTIILNGRPYTRPLTWWEKTLDGLFLFSVFYFCLISLAAPSRLTSLFLILNLGMLALNGGPKNYWPFRRAAPAPRKIFGRVLILPAAHAEEEEEE